MCGLQMLNCQINCQNKVCSFAQINLSLKFYQLDGTVFYTVIMKMYERCSLGRNLNCSVKLTCIATCKLIDENYNVIIVNKNLANFYGK